MTVARIVIAVFFFLLSLAVAFAWMSSTSATSDFTLSDKIIFYSTEGGLWYTSNADGGLIKAGPIDHGAKISALSSHLSAMGFKWINRPPYTLIIVPYWAILLVTAPLCLVFPWRQMGRRHRYGRCPNCDYDLRTTPHRCPECGTPIGRGGIRAN